MDGWVVVWTTQDGQGKLERQTSPEGWRYRHTHGGVSRTWFVPTSADYFRKR
jgi:hypothetical protein